jgi:uncharacterized membrane protein
MKKILLYLMSLFYTLAGLLHFIIPEFYKKMMPSYLPAHDLLILLSGIAEVILGLSLLIPKTRKIACYGVIALLIAIFPANVFMLQQAMNGVDMGASVSALAIRLPFQFLFIYWAWSVREVS